MTVTVLRQYFAYDIIDSKSFNVTLDITMKITNKQPYFLLPVDGYRPDLKITDTERNNMIILSDHEFEEMYGSSMNEIKESFVLKLEKNIKKYKKMIKEYRVIAVLFNGKNSNEYYEKVRVQWKNVTNIKDDGWISKYSEIPIVIPRYGFEQSSSSAIYLSIHIDSKHKILEEPTVSDSKNKKIEYKTILDSMNHKIYRFDETTQSQLIHVNVKMGLPNTIINWAKLGLITGIISIISIVTLTSITQKVPEFTFEFMAGVIALLIGERILIFQDMPLMKKWNKIYRILTVSCMVILVIFIFLSELLQVNA